MLVDDHGILQKGISTKTCCFKFNIHCRVEQYRVYKKQHKTKGTGSYQAKNYNFPARASKQ